VIEDVVRLALRQACLGVAFQSIKTLRGYYG
jgi:hypothetical protein